MRTQSKVLLVVMVLTVLVIMYKVLTQSRIKLIPFLIQSTTQTVPPKNEYLNIVPQIASQNSFLKAPLHSGGKTFQIFLHYKGDLISDAIMNSGTWENHLMVHFVNYIKEHPGIQMLDVGSNLGVYTLTAAAYGCTVVAVDANPNNTARLVQSIIINRLQNKTTVCLNAMSNMRKSFVINPVSSNIGGSRIVEAKNNSQSVKTIFMDDLIPFYNKDKEVMLKIDIEGSEIDAFRQANNFFDQLNVTFVMMEWDQIKRQAGIQYVLDFFTKRQFKPCTDYQKKNLLVVANFLSWPWDVFWIK